MILATFLCLAYFHDADTIRCASGQRVRIAGIEAGELRGGCHLDRCPTLSGIAARDRVRSMYQGKTLICRQVGTSYKRIVATCSYRGRDVGCEIVRVGAAVRWEKYARQYGLPRCR